MAAQVTYQGGTHFHVKSSLRSLKNIGGSFQKRTATWKFPVNPGVVRDLRLLIPDLELPPNLKEVLDGFGFPLEELGDHVHLHKAYPYQREAMQYLLSSPHNGSLLALSPGLGKTMTSIIAADMAGFKKVLVVAPKPLMLNWLNEHRKWSTNNEVRITWKEPPRGTGWCITSYETLVKYPGMHAGWHPDLVIFDESVMVKNRGTLRFRAAKNLLGHVGKMWLLSGSPITRYPDDLFTQLHLCDPKLVSSYWRFAERYCIINRTPFGTAVAGPHPQNNPADDFRSLMLVRNQKDVLPDLPELMFQTYSVDLTPKQWRIHEALRGQFIAELDSGAKLETPNIIAQLIRLQQVTSNLANLGEEPESAKEELLANLFESGAIPKPAVVWVHWRATGESVTNRLKKIGVHAELASGTTDASAAIQAFKTGRAEVLVLSLGVGKFGHTLTNAKAAVYFDKTWDADAYVQSMARLHRIGLEHRPLIVTLRAPSSVDDLVEDNLAGKLPAITKVSQADLANLLRGIGR